MFIFLGLVFNVNGMIWCHILAWSSAALSLRSKHSKVAVDPCKDELIDKLTIQLDLIRLTTSLEGIMARGRPSKKAHIVEVACELFTKQGYQSTSIDQVVFAAGVSKPTVYSNFPTKLVLWETVLSSLTARAKEEMGAVLLTQKAAKQATLISGWMALWSAWVGGQERLAVYRILLGEQHKMQPSTTELFDQFEAVLESVLLAWLTAFEVSQRHFFALKAISKEAMLSPALLNQPLMPRDELARQLEWVAWAEVKRG